MCKVSKEEMIRRFIKVFDEHDKVTKGFISKNYKKLGLCSP